MKYKKVNPEDFGHIQVGVGVILSRFNPNPAQSETNFDISDIIGATSGGLKFDCGVKYEDWGSDIDNVPPNTMELKRRNEYDPHITGTFVTITAGNIATLLGSAIVTTSGKVKKITPVEELKKTDFKDIWIAADYSNDNSEENGGCIAVHVKNALNTASFKWSTADGKGKFDFDFQGHYSLENIDDIPFEIYVLEPDEEGE